MNVKVVLSLAVAMASMMAPLARAQYTPGNGGVYVPPPSNSPGIYVGPSMPSVPSPTAPPSPGYPQPGPLMPTSPAAVQVVQPPTVVVPQLSDAQMADLTASIALYPDPLLAEVFPASTYVEELTYADKWLEQHPGAPEVVIAGLPVHEEVKAIMHYPTVLNLLTDHLDWTQAIGTAFLYQRVDLMESVQRWRSTAVAYGTLYTTPQQQVLQQAGVIIIQPPPLTQVVYVPVYDPAVVYVRPRLGAPRDYIRFSGVGFSLTFVVNDLDWHDRVVYVPRHDHDHPWPENDGRGGRGDGRGGDGRGGSGGGAGGGGRSGGGTGGGSGGGTGGGGRSGGGTGGGTGGGRGGSAPAAPETKTVFVRDTIKPGLMYPEKIVTPTPDKKVVTVPAAPSGRGAGVNNPGRGTGGQGAPGQIRGGGVDGNPNTPF